MIHDLHQFRFHAISHFAWANPRRACMLCALLALLCITRAYSDAAAAPSVREVPAAHIQKGSSAIDRLLLSEQHRHGIRQERNVSHETFLRRSYLHIAGRIPTFSETESFVNDAHPKKRSHLIDNLLDSEAYNHHRFTFWADLLRAQSRMSGLQGQATGSPYLEWIKAAIAENKPYNKMVRELVAAEGAYWESGNGSVGYYFRDRGMPLDNMANTTRVFLGTRIECAQCHDHPFEKWTQLDFFEMAAFTSGQGNLVLDKFQDTRRQIKQMEKTRNFSPEISRLGRPLIQLLSAGLDNTGNGTIRLPADYAYENAKPKAVVKAAPLFGDLVPLNHSDASKNKGAEKNARQRKQNRSTPGIGSREAFADWIIDTNNPRFTRVIANRLWKDVFGRGLFEPVDDLNDDTACSHPQLMAYLESLMIDLNYDTKQFLRVLYNTQAFQKPVVSRDIAPSETFYVEGPLLRRMSAEQMWDSLLTLTVPDVDARKGRDNAAVMRYAYEKYKDYSASQLVDEIERLLSSNNNDSMQRPNIFQPLRNLYNIEMSSEAGRMEAPLRKQKELREKLRVAEKRKRSGEVQRLRRLLQEKGLNNPALRNPGFVRAAELPSPAPAGHFIREFGSSDREQIANASDAASVPQVLSLMNGFVDNTLLPNKQSELWRTVNAAGTNNDRITILYKTLLNREPSRTEMTQSTRDMRARNDEALEDLLWVIVNSREFMFVL
ncbi:MAG: hypothetical protein ACI9OU_001036 [Candidatus Promineifilaceae bacterium]|jgi:hypothetical protein